ncbi:site-specific integrase [Limnohabitans sp.]|uniref:site-specific integrase n=1 Tax=Limnohabitans sp. TaxID=1907725 RepID=UPI00289CD126|nr:site-specific integrase [Limnohabitans sp.]
MIKVPRLKTNRHGVFCVRVYWRDDAGRLRESLHSLGTKSATVARLLALQFNTAYEQQRAMTSKPTPPKFDDLLNKFELDISKGIMKAEGPEDFANMMKAMEAYKAMHGTLPNLQEAMNMGRPALPSAESPKRLLLRSKRLSEVVALYLEERKLDNKENTRKEKARTYADFVDLLGDLEINLYTKAEGVQWKTHDMGRGLKATSINSRIGELNDLFKWAINNGHYTASDKSPVDGLRIGKKSRLAAKHQSYEPFNNDELKTIFGTGYLQKFNKPDFYWLPIVALFTGARREELASLKAANVKTVDDVACFQIEEGKNADARRLVPIHPQLIALGFMDYAKQVQSLGAEYLFPHLIDGPNGRGKNTGRHFSNWLEYKGITDSRKVFHSFRHTVTTRLHATGANPAHVMQITGHKGEMGQTVHFGTYTHDVGLQALTETLGKLTYSLDLHSLKLPDPTFKNFLNRWKMIETRKTIAAKP